MPKNTSDTRPRIWAQGSQNPPFDIRAFALASVVYARDSLSGLLGRCSASATGFGAEVAAGRWRVPEHRLGRRGRFLPSVGHAAAAIRGGADVLARAARVVGHGAEAEEPPMAFAALEPAARPRPVQLLPVPEEDIDLAAIRALMKESPAAPAARTEASPADAAPLPARHSRITDGLATGFAWLLGHALLAMSLPVGAILAALAHLNGEDLRKVVAEA